MLRTLNVSKLFMNPGATDRRGLRALFVICDASNILHRYKYDWSYDEAKKNILRTHTTAVSARMLYQIAQQVIIDIFRVYWMIDVS